MTCSDRSECARRLTEELTLILRWDFYYSDGMTLEDRTAQDFRRKQLMQELLKLRLACAIDTHGAGTSPCHVQLFFGACAGGGFATARHAR